MFKITGHVLLRLFAKVWEIFVVNVRLGYCMISNNLCV